MNKTVSIVIPCFNESAVIASTHAALDRSLGASQNLNFEFVYVDDGSSDGTSSILRDIRKRDPRVQLVRFSRNFGHQAAVSAGIDHAFGDAVAIMDADLQDPPEVLLGMLEKWREGFEVVYGVRRKRKEGLFKRVCYRLFYRIWKRMADIEVPADSGDFCVMDRQVADVLRGLPENGALPARPARLGGLSPVRLRYERAARHAGEPKYSFVRLVRLAASGIFNFSDVPLRFISLAGFVTSAGAIIGAMLLLLQRLFDDPHLRLRAARHARLHLACSWPCSSSAASSCFRSASSANTSRACMARSNDVPVYVVAERARRSRRPRSERRHLPSRADELVTEPNEAHPNGR